MYRNVKSSCSHLGTIAESNDKQNNGTVDRR